MIMRNLEITIFFLREREGQESEGQRERENPMRGRERERSGVHSKGSLSSPIVRLVLMNHEIMT